MPLSSDFNFKCYGIKMEVIDVKSLLLYKNNLKLNNAIYFSIKKETISLDRTPGESLGFDVCGTDSDGPVRVFVRKIKPSGLADRLELEGLF